MNRLRRLVPWLLLCACESERAPEPWQSQGGRSGASLDISTGAPSPTGGSIGGGGDRSSVAGGRANGGARTGSGGAGASHAKDAYPDAESVLSLLTRSNADFMNEWPDPGAMIDFSRESHIWTRAVYYEGLMALHALSPNAAYYEYAVSWGKSHAWGLRRGATGVFADDQCAGQTYIDLYALDPQPERITDLRISLDTMLKSNVSSNWYWIDAIQLSMPVFAKFGALMNDSRYFDKMAALYEYTRNSAGDSSDAGGASGMGGPLYDTNAHLWWQDRDFDPPYSTANGKPCYSSHGNGWVLAGLSRVLSVLPTSDPHRGLYLQDFQDLSRAILAVQRSDGFWNTNLGDPDDYGGPELSGSSLFVYGMAWGVRSGHLDETAFKPAIVNGWHAMASAVHTDDVDLGCFLLGGSEVARLAAR